MRRAARTALRTAAALAWLGAAACSAPEDADPHRPIGVWPTPFEQHDLRVLDARVRYIDEGPRRAPAVLMIPGHTSRIEEYDALVPTLARNHRVLVLDYPGSGYAEKPVRDYDLAYYEDVSIAFLDALGVDHAFLVGGSQGGNLVLRLGHRFPRRFPRLAPWAPGSAWEASPRLAALTRAVASYAMFWPIVWIQSRYWYDESFPGRDEALATTFAYYHEVMGPGFVRMYFGMAADQVEHSLFPLAPEIRQPVWLGWGDQDDGADMGEGVARLHELLPHSELVIFPGAGHALATEVPGALVAEIDAFLRRPADALP
ncbi:MAG TPA: alpha/beta hydrolase [Myxococcota bacterium]|nr:alpha/beta hydrolase [Myxococcota bacterium]